MEGEEAGGAEEFEGLAAVEGGGVVGGPGEDLGEDVFVAGVVIGEAEVVAGGVVEVPGLEDEAVDVVGACGEGGLGVVGLADGAAEGDQVGEDRRVWKFGGRVAGGCEAVGVGEGAFGGEVESGARVTRTSLSWA